MPRFAATIILGIVLAMLGRSALAQPEAQPVTTSKQFGPYTVHYSLFPSTFISESIAASYQIVRAPNRAVLNVSVRKQSDGSEDRAASALINGRYSDLIQSKQLEFREIREQGAIYYIAELRHGDKELLRFDLNVQPDPNGRAYPITFTRKLHIEP